MRHELIKAFMTAVLGITILSNIAEAKPLKVYILAGQSNMEGHAKVSTFPYIAKDPKTAAIYKEMVDSDGKPVVSKDVYISYLTNTGGWGNTKPVEKNGPLKADFGAQKNGPKIGPEYTFGIYMNKLTKEPILLIKTAWGGKSLHTDFRSPSAGPFKFNEAHLKRLQRERKNLEKEKAEKEKATGKYYKLMIDHVKKVLKEPKKYHPAYNEKDGYEIAGFVWFQGWNDMVDASIYPNRNKKDCYSDYTELLATFIRDVRNELNAPEMPFVIGVLGVEGPTKDFKKEQLRYKHIHENFRDAMAAPAETDEFKGNVAAVYTEKFWDKELDKIDLKWRNKQQELKKNKSMSQEERKKAFDEFISKSFTDREIDLIKNARSNHGFHYFGSAKILGQIGKAFAEAMNKMEDNK